MRKLKQVKRQGIGALNIICILLFSVACSKEEILSQKEMNEKLLVGSGSKTWLIVSATYNGTEYLPNCVKDDHWTFRMDENEMNKVVSRKNVTTLCTNGLKNNEASAWSMDNDGSRLTIFGGRYRIISLTENEMILEFLRKGDIFIDTFKKN